MEEGWPTRVASPCFCFERGQEKGSPLWSAAARDGGGLHGAEASGQVPTSGVLRSMGPRKDPGSHWLLLVPPRSRGPATPPGDPRGPPSPARPSPSQGTRPSSALLKPLAFSWTWGPSIHLGKGKLCRAGSVCLSAQAVHSVNMSIHPSPHGHLAPPLSHPAALPKVADGPGTHARPLWRCWPFLSWPPLPLDSMILPTAFSPNSCLGLVSRTPFCSL